MVDNIIVLELKYKNEIEIILKYRNEYKNIIFNEINNIYKKDIMKIINYLKKNNEIIVKEINNIRKELKEIKFINKNLKNEIENLKLIIDKKSYFKNINNKNNFTEEKLNFCQIL